MTAPVEHADGDRGDGTFPASWGVPPRDASARRAWIVTHARRSALLRKLSPPWSAYRRVEDEKREARP